MILLLFFHLFRKGISQSALPYRRSVPTWLKLSGDDVQEQIFKLAKKGLTPSQIGIHFEMHLSLHSSCCWVKALVALTDRLTVKAIVLHTFTKRLKYRFFFFHRCHSEGLARCCSGAFRYRQQGSPHLEEEGFGPRASRGPVLPHQEGCCHPQTLGEEPKGPRRKVPPHFG